MSTRTCSDCGKPITLRGKTGLCRKCIWDRQMADPEFQRRRIEAQRSPSFKPGRKCRGCSSHLCPRNRTGLCLTCFNKDSAHSAKRAAGVSAYRKRMAREDPEFAERQRERGRSMGSTGKGNEATPAGSEPRRRAGKKMSARYMGWCPDEYRDEYKRLKRSKKLGAAAAKKAILAKLTPFELQMHALRNGARLVEKPILRKREHDFTLGGVTDWAA